MEDKKALEGPAPEAPTKKAQMFCRLLLEGKSTVDAHKLAGYKGDPHAAYELRGKCKAWLASEAERRGINVEGLKMAAAALNELPVLQGSVNVREKLAIMAETRKIVELAGGGAKGATISALIIERPPRGPVVEAEIVPSEGVTGVKEPQAHPNSPDSQRLGEAGQADGEQGLPPADEDEPPTGE